MSEELEALTGKIRFIRYKKEEFIIANFATAEGQQLFILGNVFKAKVGMELTLFGNFTTHPDYGKQFKFKAYRLPKQAIPQTATGWVNYILSLKVPGLGMKRAEAIVEAFDVRTLHEKLEDVAALCDIVKPSMAKDLVMNYRAEKSDSDVFVFLFGLGLTGRQAAKVYDRYGDSIVDRLRENPYILTQIHGFGFLRTDKLATEHFDVALYSPFRLNAAIIHTLKDNEAAGNTRIARNNLITQTNNLLGSLSGLRPHIEIAISVHKDIVLLGADISLLETYKQEKSIATKLYSLLEEVDTVKRLPESSLNVDQERAVLNALNYRVSILTGLPGTGKTYSLNAILEHLQPENPLLVAPTGKAAKRMTEQTGRQAYTIHKALGLTGQPVNFELTDLYISSDLVIVDETSMVPTYLMNLLVCALPSTCRFVIVGDADQLPSIGAGNVLRDLISSELLPTVKLTKIERQAKDSTIITNAHAINRGVMPYMKARDFSLIETDTDVTAAIADVIKRRRLDIKDVQILSPQYKGLGGVNEINETMQAMFNPKAPDKREATFFGILYREGDKVLQTKNDYENGVFNGEDGRILQIWEDEISIDFGGKSVLYDYGEFKTVVLGYCTTIHKAQGSEYKHLILSFLSRHYVMLQRTLLYTAITRGVETVTLVGQRKAVQLAVRNNQVNRRLTNLQMLLDEASWEDAY